MSIEKLETPENPASVYPYGRSGEKPRLNVVGPDCGELLRTTRSRLQPFRYASAWLLFSRDAGTGDLVRVANANTPLKLWTKGFGEAGLDAGVPRSLTLAETDALQDGSIVDDGQRYIVEGLGVEMGDPFVFAQIGEAPPYVLENQNPPWLDEYSDRLQRKVMESTVLKINHGSSGGGCEARLGPLSMWPACAHPGSAVTESSGLAGRFTYFAYPDVTFGLSSTTKLNMDVSTEFNVRVQNNATMPTVSDVFVPIRVLLWGWPECIGPARMNIESLAQLGDLLLKLQQAGGGMEGLKALLEQAAKKG